MHQHPFLSIALVVIVALLEPGVARAVSNPPFDCTYSLHNITGATATVSLQLTVRLANRSAGEVHYGALRVLHDSEMPGNDPESYAEFTGISMPLGRSTEFRQNLILSIAQYEQWNFDGPLSAEMTWVDDNGLRHSSQVEIKNHPGDTQD